MAALDLAKLKRGLGLAFRAHLETETSAKFNQVKS